MDDIVESYMIYIQMHTLEGFMLVFHWMDQSYSQELMLTTSKTFTSPPRHQLTRFVYRFYARTVSPLQILNGEIEPPRAAQPLYDALDRAMATLPNARYNFEPPN